jgi:hemerythrin-like domain-containing protein
MSVGLKIVYSEHQRLAAVLSCLLNIAEAEHEQVSDAVLDTVDALLSYIEEFVYRYHHPKEDKYLFPAIGRRCPHTLGHIAELEKQHESGTGRIAELRSLLEVTRSDRSAIGELLPKIESYATFENEHMILENTRIFSVAKECLKAEDWELIDKAFTDHNDPVFGDNASEQLRNRFSEIVAHAPAPFGLADPEQPPAQTQPHGVWEHLKQMLSGHHS